MTTLENEIYSYLLNCTNGCEKYHYFLSIYSDRHSEMIAALDGLENKNLVCQKNIGNEIYICVCNTSLVKRITH